MTTAGPYPVPPAGNGPAGANPYATGAGSPAAYAAPTAQAPGQYGAYPNAGSPAPNPANVVSPGAYPPQAPLVLRCPVCWAISPVGTSNCPGCRTSLAGVAPVPATAVQQPPNQQGGPGGFLQSDGGKLAMGALGGAAAVIGGEMLLHGLERSLEGNDYGHHHHHHHHGHEGGVLGDLGRLADDVGLI
uniref:DZANK-type domain-containing protein n=1 Tax=Thermogemmatispora argillosa TaxID=2045280 RepID=A0A455T3I1_9CHLR|nr:hypothetical protein KTA_01330 [Thermogemmatispora argillosa]